MRNRIGNLQPALRGDLQVHLRCAASSRCYVKLWQLEPKLGNPISMHHVPLYKMCMCTMDLYLHAGCVHAR